MNVSDIIDNINFDVDFPYVVRTTNDYGDILSEYYSWEDEIPKSILDSEIVYLNIVNGYCTMTHTAVMVIDVYENF